MNRHDFLFAAPAFGAELLGTLSGFGSSTFLVPAAIRIEDFQVLALTAILHCFSNFSKLFLFEFRLSRSRDLRIIFASIAFSAIGAALSSYVPVDLLRRTLGMVPIALCGFGTGIQPGRDRRRYSRHGSDREESHSGWPY